MGIKDRILKVNQDAPLEIISLVEQMLVYSPEKRIRPAEALKLPVFKNLPEEKFSDSKTEENSTL
jgi:serine/threonine protein kinase